MWERLKSPDGTFGLIMLKNHISWGYLNAVKVVKENLPLFIGEVETTTLEEVQQAIGAGADIIMLDNMVTKLWPKL